MGVDIQSKNLVKTTNNITLKTFLRETNEKLTKRNDKFSNYEDQWVKKKVAWQLREKELEKKAEDDKKIIEELKGKNEDKKHIIYELKLRQEKEKKAMIELKEESYVKIKNENEDLKKKYQNASSEINKLAGFLKIFGKNEIIFVTNIQIVLPN